MLYYFIDETRFQEGAAWHCAIGGVVVPAASFTELELALGQAIGNVLGMADARSLPEFKFADFFRAFNDRTKFAVAREIANAAKRFSVRGLVGCASCATTDLGSLIEAYGSAELAVQYLALAHLARNVADLTADTLVQTVVDLGISESFRPIYDLYLDRFKGELWRRIGDAEGGDLLSAHVCNLPLPMFIDSRDSRVMQLADLVLGLLTSRSIRTSLSPFKRELIAALAVLLEGADVHSRTWRPFINAETSVTASIQAK